MEQTEEWIDVRSTPATVISCSSPVGLLVRHAALRVAPDCSVASAALVMAEHDVSALLLGDGEAIVTERDIARGVAGGWSPDAWIETLATHHPVVVDASMPVVRAAGLMLNQQVRHLVVRLDGETVGLLSLRDIVAVLLQTADPELWLTSLRVAISGPPDIWIG